MTKTELIKSLKQYPDDAIVIIGDGNGWANIDFLTMDGSAIMIMMEKYPIFSDN